MLECRLSSGWRHSSRHCSRIGNLTIAVLLNCPGNAVVGDVEGLALLSGTSKEVAWPRFVAMTAIATAPVPGLVLMGLLNIEIFIDTTGLMYAFLT